VELSPVEVGLIGFILLFILFALGVPVGFSMAAVGFAGMWYLISGTAAFAKITITSFETISSYDLATLPLFLVMAYVTLASGLTKDLYNLVSKWMGHRAGGIAMATVGACAGFAAVSASSIATAATMGSVALPEMKKYNYAPSLSTGCVAAGGTIGSLIPPSGVLIIYGILTGTSIGALFAAGIIPGLLQAGFYIAAIYLLCRLKPELGPSGPKTTFREKWTALMQCGEILLLIVLVLGGLIGGLFTPTESGAVAAFGAIVCSLIRRRLTWDSFSEALKQAMRTTGMIYCILIGAFIFNAFLTVTMIPHHLSDFIVNLDLPPFVVMVAVMGVYLILGCFIDSAAMVTLTIPIFFPLAKSMGFHPVWFGIIVTRAMEIAMITPPVGMNVYVISGVAGDEVPMTTIFRGIVPFLLADVVHVALLFLLPATVLFLPSIMR